jgi:nucleotide-binding universal stress UspA family protein
MHPIHTILCPTDFSPESEYAFEVACGLARDLAAGMVVLHVVPRPVLGTVLTHLEFYDRAVEELARLRPADPAVRVDRVTSMGDPAERILATAQAARVDLIVMGTHGRTGVGRLLLGSVAETVLRKANCAVLTVKPPPLAIAAHAERQFADSRLATTS